METTEQESVESSQTNDPRQASRYRKVIVLFGSILALIVALFLLAVFATQGLILGFLSPNYERFEANVPFPEAHEKAVRTFVQSEHFGYNRFQKSGLWNASSIAHEGQTWRVQSILLVGATPEYGIRIFGSLYGEFLHAPYGYPPRKELISEAPWRVPTDEESKALQRLMEGRSDLEQLPVHSYETEVTSRLIAPVHATADCQECHDAGEGEMLGAFSYHLIPLEFEANGPY